MSVAGSTPRRVHVVVNPRGGARARAALRCLLAELGAIAADVQQTAAPGDARRWAASLPRAADELAVVIGGDGTLHEVVNGLMERPDGQRLPVGVVPAGSGNSLARDLGLLDATAAVRRALSGGRRPLDLARLSLPGGRTLYAFHMLGFGLAADAGRLAERLRRLGPSRYTLASALVALRARHRRARIVLDDEVLEGDFALLYAGNTRHSGAGMVLAPEARIDDGLLDVLVVRAAAAPTVLGLLARVRSGRPLDSPLVTRRRVRRLRIEEASPSVLNVDGEVTGSTPVDVELVPGAVTLSA